MILIIHDEPMFVRCMNLILNTIPSFSSTIIYYHSLEELQKFLKDKYSTVANQIKLVIVQAEFGKGERYKRKGIEIIETLRRDWHFRAPILILSLDAQERVAQKYPIAKEGVPGIYFLEVPFELKNLKAIIISTRRITTEQLKDVVVNYCHLEKFLGGILHDIINALRADRISVAKEKYEVLRCLLAAR